MLVYELSGCGFESRYSPLDIDYINIVDWINVEFNNWKIFAQEELEFCLERLLWNPSTNSLVIVRFTKIH